MYIVGIDNKPVTYDFENGWSSNASDDVQLIGNAMMGTPEGKKVLNHMLSAEYGITINCKEGFHSTQSAKLGETLTTINSKTDAIKSVEVNLYDGALNKSISDYEQANKYGIINPTENQKLLTEQKPSLKERIGQVGAHEGTHATNRDAVSTFVGTEAAEKVALNIENTVIKQTPVYIRAIPVVVKPIQIDR